MIFITSKVLNLVRSARNRLRPVWITFVWNCLPCFSNTKIGSVTSSFDIVQFSRSCAPQPCGWQLIYFITFVINCQALFWEAFELFWTWIVQQFLGANRNIWTFIGSFQGLPAGISEVILLSQRLALKYNTTPRCGCQHFLTSFLKENWAFFTFTVIVLLPYTKRPSMHCTDGLWSII